MSYETISTQWPRNLGKSFQTSFSRLQKHSKKWTIWFKWTNKFSFTNIVTFGGCQDDFMLVVSCSGSDQNEPESTQKMLFKTSKPKILEITLLIADYMNMMGQLLPHKTSQTSSRVHSRSVSRSRLTSSTLTAINSAPNTPRLNPKDDKAEMETKIWNFNANWSR